MAVGMTLMELFKSGAVLVVDACDASCVCERCEPFVVGSVEAELNGSVSLVGGRNEYAYSRFHAAFGGDK